MSSIEQDVYEMLVTYIVENQDKFYRLAFSYAHNQEDALDIVQNAVCKALENYQNLNNQRAIRTWMYRIAANKVIDARRRTRLSPVPLEETELPAAEDFVSQIHNQALLDAIEGYVSGLDAGEQAVFRLRIYGEKTFPEIAAALDEPEAAVKSRYYRLMGRLRKEFGADG